MSRIPPVLKPINRHITIIPHIKKNETSTGVLLPEDFEIEEDRFITATVMDVAADCCSPLQKLRSRTIDDKLIVIERAMIEEIVVRNKSYFTILENYVVGILRGANED